MASSEQNSSLREKTVKGVFWSAAESWGTQATQFILFVILARIIGPESFGLISLANIFIHFVQALIGSGFSDAIVQRKDLEAKHLDTAFWVNLGIGALLALFGIFSASFIARFFSNSELTPIVQILSINVFLNSLGGIQEAVLRRNLDFKSLAARRVGGTFLGGLVGISMAFAGYGVWSLVGQTLVGNSMGIFLLWRASPWRPGYQVSIKHFKELSTFGINTIGIGILVFINRRGDDLLIGYYLGSVALGYYSVGYKVLIMINQILGDTTRKVALSTFSRLQENPDKLRNALYIATSLVSSLAIPMFIFVCIFSDELVIQFFGEQWLLSASVMKALSFVGIAQSISYFNGSIVMAKGKPQWSFGMMLISTVLRLVGFTISVRWGIIAIAYSLVIAEYFLLPIKILMVKRVTGIRGTLYAKQFIPPLIGTIASSFVVLGVQNFVLSGYVSLIVELIVCSFIYSIFYLFLMAKVNPSTFSLFKSLVMQLVPTKSPT